jgi:hypothetical protein
MNDQIEERTVEPSSSSGSNGPEPADIEPRRAPRWRRILGAVLLVIGIVLVPVSLSAVWVRNTLLDTDNYVATVGPLASNSDIQHGVADRVTTALFASGEAEKRIKDALPQRAKVLAAPISSGLESVTNDAALKLAQSNQFQTLWKNANRRAHAAIVKVLTGGGSRVSTKDGTVSINLEQIFDNVKQRLDQRGITVLDSVQLPAKYQSLVLIQSKTLEQVQGAVDLLQTIAWVLPFIALLCFAGALALSSNRRRTLERAGIWVALAVGIQLVLLSVGRNFYLDAITSAGARSGSAGAVWDQLTSFLRTAGATAIVIALIVAIAAWVAGPSRGATKVRNTWGQALGGKGSPADGSEVTADTATSFVARHKKALRVVGLAIAIVVLILWNHPTAGTVLVVGILLLVYLAVVEFLGRASVDTNSATLDAPTT